MNGADAVRAFLVSYLEARARDKGIGQVAVADDLHMVNCGLIDSLGFLALITDLEEQFGIEVDLSESDAEEFLTVGGLVRIAAARRAPPA